MGPSGFQTKGLESHGVVEASLFFSQPALCCVLCSTLTVGEYSLGVYPALWPCCVEYSYWISYSYSDLSRTVVLVLKFLVFIARWNNLRVVDVADGHEIFCCVVLKLVKYVFFPGKVTQLTMRAKIILQAIFVNVKRKMYLLKTILLMAH